MVDGSVRLSKPASSTVAPTSKRPSLRGIKYAFGERITWRISSRFGIARHSIWPLTGRVGKGCGPICPAHAPAQLTTLAARKEVFGVVTPEIWLSERFTAVTGSPEEKST